MTAETPIPETGDDIRIARATLRITQSELSDRLGVSLNTVRRYEASTRLDNIVSFAVAYLLIQVKPVSVSAMTPEERAELKFRERKHLRDLEAAAGITRGYRPMDPSVRLERQEEIARLKGVRKRNAARNRDRPTIAALHQALSLIAGEETVTFQYGPEFAPFQYPKQRTAALADARHRAIMGGHYHVEAYCNAADNAPVPGDSPLVLLPLEDE